MPDLATVLSNLEASVIEAIEATLVSQQPAYELIKILGSLRSIDAAASSIVSNQTTRRSLASNLVLTASDTVFQLLDPNGSSRNVDLPVGSAHLRFVIENIATLGTAFNLVVRNSGGSTVATLPAQHAAEFLWDGSTWQFYVIQPPGAVAITGGSATGLSNITIDTTNANIVMSELGTNAGLELQGKTGKTSYIDLKQNGSLNFTGRLIPESATAFTLWGGSGVTINSRAPFQVLSTVCQLTTATGTVSVLRYASGSDATFANNTICWDFTKTAAENFALYRYNSGVPSEVFNISKSTGLTTFLSPIAFNRATIVINSNTTLTAAHIGSRVIITAAADLTLPSTLGAQGNEIEFVIATSGTVRLVQGASATLKWHNGTSTLTGTRTFQGDGVISQLRFTGTGAAQIWGGVS